MKVLILPLLAALFLSFVAAWGSLSWRSQASSLFGLDSEVKVRPIAEYEPTFGIGLSEQILQKKQGLALLKAIIEADSRIYLFLSGEKREAMDKILRSTPLLHGTDRDSIIKIQLEHESTWVRDYMPIPILKKFPHITPTPTFVDFVYRDGNTLDDAAIHQMGLAINLSVDHLPIVMDGGNFASNGKDCLLSEEVSDDPEILLLNSAEQPLLSNIDKVFRSALGCRNTKIVSQIPHPHVDMWMKFLNSETLLINQIDAKDIESFPGLSRSEKEKALKISEALNQVAESLKSDYKIIRLPSPVPSEELSLTYANAILVNGTAIVPRYSKELSQDAQDTLETWQWKKNYLETMETRIQDIYKNSGFKVIAIDSNEWIKDGGSFHCVTFHLPDIDAVLKLSQKKDP